MVVKLLLNIGTTLVLKLLTVKSYVFIYLQIVFINNLTIQKAILSLDVPWASEDLEKPTKIPKIKSWHFSLEAYSEPCQTSKMESFSEIVNG